MWGTGCCRGGQSFVTSLTPTSQTLPPFMELQSPSPHRIQGPETPSHTQPQGPAAAPAGQCHPTVAPSGSATDADPPHTHTPILPLLPTAPAPSLDVPP